MSVAILAPTAPGHSARWTVDEEDAARIDCEDWPDA